MGLNPYTHIHLKLNKGWSCFIITITKFMPGKNSNEIKDVLIIFKLGVLIKVKIWGN